MSTIDKNDDDIIMDLEIPFYVYILLFFIFVIILIIKYLNPNEEIFDFIEKSRHDSQKTFSEDENKLKLLTKLNTKINRDYLDNSKYYFEKGYNKIYHNELQSTNEEKEKLIKESKKEKFYIKKNKKVGFSNNVIYEDDF